MYQWKGMEKIEGLTALDLFRQDKEIFLLYDEDTESAAESEKDIENHMFFGGEFGIEIPLNSNKLNDRYIQMDIENKQNKKSNISYWDRIDNIGQEALEKVAEMIGIKIVDWADFDSIKEITHSLVNIIEYRFDVKFPYIDEDY